MSAELNGSGTDDGVAGTAARPLALVAAAFEEDVGDRPTLAELVEVLGWGVPSGEPCLEAPSATIRLRARRRRRAPDHASRVGDLGDAVFVEASDALAELARELAARQERPVTLAELASALTTGLGTVSGITSDTAEDLVAIDVVEPKVAKRLKVGDVVAIPAGESGYRLAVVLARNGWGTALGVFTDTVSSPRPSVSRLKAVIATIR